MSTIKSALKKNVANKTRKNVVIDTERNQEKRFTPYWKREENEKKDQAERVRKNAERTSPPSDSEDIIYLKRDETKAYIPVLKKASPTRSVPVRENTGPIRNVVRSVFKFFSHRGGSKGKNMKSRKSRQYKTKTRK
jgi:hypothetical protein